jgi:hypothetical protein
VRERHRRRVVNELIDSSPIAQIGCFSNGAGGPVVRRNGRRAHRRRNPSVVVNNVTINTSPGGPTLPGKRVEVTYTHDYVFVGPMLGWFGGSLSSVPVRGTAVMRDEAANPPGGGGS